MDGDPSGRDYAAGTPGKRKRNRYRASCLPCQQRKTKCDRNEPCNACAKRRQGHLCSWETPQLLGLVPDNMATEFLAMRRRLDRLEHAVKNGDSSRIKKSCPSPSSEQADTTNAAHNQASAAAVDTLRGSPTDNSSHDVLQGLSNDDGTASMSSVMLSSRNFGEASEAEEAIQALEDLALGRNQYLPLGMNTLVPCVGMMAPDSELTQPSQPVPIPPGKHTTILCRSSQPQKTPAPAFFQRSSHATKQQALMDRVPSKSVSDVVVAAFFQESHWLYHVLHRPTFLAECEELNEFVCRNDNERMVDPAWLATYFIVLAWGISNLSSQRQLPKSLQDYPADEIAELPSIWRDASMQALNEARWYNRPQARALQAILLQLSFQRPTSNMIGKEGSASFYIWLGAAHRIAQLLELHKLGKYAWQMPREDPAWPKQPCSLRRELAKRLWYFIVSFDWMYCLPSGMAQVTPGSFDTGEPLEVDDDALQHDLLLVPESCKPHLTDTSFSNIKWLIARYQIEATELLRKTRNVDYAAFIKLADGLKRECARLKELPVETGPTRKPYHKSLLVALVSNRLLRIHRPYFVLGWDDPKYTSSTKICIESATDIVHALQELECENLDHLWFCLSYGISAFLTLFVSLQYCRVNPTLYGNLDARGLIAALRGFYATNSQTSSNLKKINEQTVALIDTLLSIQEDSAIESTDSLFQASYVSRAFTTALETMGRPTSIGSQLLPLNHPSSSMPSNGDSLSDLQTLLSFPDTSTLNSAGLDQLHFGFQLGGGSNMEPPRPNPSMAGLLDVGQDHHFWIQNPLTALTDWNMQFHSVVGGDLLST